jgi:hypothetical protein
LKQKGNIRILNFEIEGACWANADDDDDDDGVLDWI